MKKKIKQLKEKMIEHLAIANRRGFKDKAMKFTTEEIKIIIEKLDK